MNGKFRTGWTRFSEGLAAFSFAVLFFAFIVQVVSRYIFNAPIAWTLELCSISYVWVVFWTCGILLSERTLAALQAQVFGKKDGAHATLAVRAQHTIALVKDVAGSWNHGGIISARRLARVGGL